MKRLTSNQQQYKKQIKRIRKNLSKLRKEGYDVSKLAEKYTSELPSRVTAKKLQELKEITPKKLKAEAPFYGYQPPKGTPLTAPYTQYTLPTTLTPTGSHLVLDRDFKQFMEEPIPETDTEDIMPHPLQEVVDESANTIYTVDTETGEIIHQEPIQETVEETPSLFEEGFEVEETPFTPPLPPIEEEPEPYYEDEEGEYTYTDEWYSEGTTEEIPDLTDYAIEYIFDIAQSFSPEISAKLLRALNKMIDEKGKESLANAFMEYSQDHPNMLERLSNIQERYKEMKEMMGELAEKLDVDINLKDLMRHDITSNSMADMEDYMD